MLITRTTKEQQKIIDEIDEIALERETTVPYPTGFDEAILGVLTNDGGVHVVYCRDDILEILMRGDDTMDYEDALEYFNYNILQQFSTPDNSPIYIDYIFRTNDSTDSNNMGQLLLPF